MKKRNYLITGRQGSGKTTVGKEFKKLGYTVFDIDHTDGLGKLRELKTNELFDFSVITAQSPDGLVDWNKYWYEVQGDKLEEILNENDLVFITGVASNIKDYYHLFNKVFVLMVDSGTARQRLMNHEHASHHSKSELERIIKNFEEKQQAMITPAQNVVQTDALQSVKGILRSIEEQIDIG